MRDTRVEIAIQTSRSFATALSLVGVLIVL